MQVIVFQSNRSGANDTFERDIVVEQIRSHQLLETLHVMVAGMYNILNQS